MWALDFDDYKVFLKAVLKTFPKRGRGQAQKLADFLGVQPMVVSHILSGERDFTPDQAVRVASYFGLDDKATEYFLYLVTQARADTPYLKNFYATKLNQIRSEAQNIKNLVAGREQLTDEEKGIFYSNWYFCGVSLLTSIEKYQTVEAIADYTGLSRAKIGEIVSFLVNTGLCIQENGKIRMSTKSTHVGDKSEFVNSHRRNWREKAREKFSEPGPYDLFYSSPVSLSEKDAELFRKEILKVIKNFSKQVEDSPEQKTMCLNIDWFEF